MEKLDCKFEIPETLTVGQLFSANCRGAMPGAELVAAGEDPYLVKLLSSEVIDASSFKFIFTSYRVGNLELPEVILQGKESSNYSLGPVNLNVKSVIHSEEGQKQEPYGPIGPLSLNVPIIFWILLGALIVSFVVSLFYFLRRRSQRKALIEKLAEHDSAQSPLHELHVTFRKIQRQNSFFHGKEATQEEFAQAVGQIDSAFRLFVLRQFRIPALEWGDRLILKEVDLDKKSLSYLDLKKVFTELSKAKTARELNSNDVVQILARATKVAESLS